MPIISETLFGTRASENSITFDPEDQYHFTARDGAKSFSISNNTLSRGLLCIGGTGSGKTNTINQLVSQIKKTMTDEDVMIIFDTKGDFYENFHSKDDGKDIIIGNSKEFYDLSERWNIFREVILDGEDDSKLATNVYDVCRCLFKKYESASQPFFVNAARGLVAAVMIYLIRISRDFPDRELLINNQSFVSWFTKAEMEQYKLLSKEYSDLTNVDMYLGNGLNDQALGVLSEAIVMMKDSFLGVFGEYGNFSIRDFIRNKGGKTLFVEYDLAFGEALSQIYSLLFDLALKEALGRQDNSKNEREKNVYIIIDEFKLLPYLTHIDDAVNFGRSMGLKVVAGLQSMAQLYDAYGKEKGQSIAAGFSSIMAFRPNDWTTTEYLRDAFGVNYLSETTLAGSLPSTERREGHVVEAWELSELKPGDAFVRLIDRSPFKFDFSEYKRR